VIATWGEMIVLALLLSREVVMLLNQHLRAKRDISPPPHEWWGVEVHAAERDHGQPATMRIYRLRAVAHSRGGTDTINQDAT